MTRLEEIEKRTKEATPGPWSVGHSRNCHHLLKDKANLWHGPGIDLTDPCAHLSEHDAKFIANARDDVPWLCQRVRELEKLEASERKLIYPVF